MAKILVIDAETTGLPSKSRELTDPAQPHLVALSALQYDSGEQRVLQSMSKVVYPEDWESHPDALAVHGLTTEYCLKYGRSEGEVTAELLHLWNDGEFEVVAHNCAFDGHILAIAIARHFGASATLTKWLTAPTFCTMQSAKPIVQAQTKPDARTGKTRIKNPNLSEAYEFFMGKPLERHHSANMDCLAALQIWNALQNYQDGE
jgi:DNA polymerase-3 subunit epsilon